MPPPIYDADTYRVKCRPRRPPPSVHGHLVDHPQLDVARAAAATADEAEQRVAPGLQAQLRDLALVALEHDRLARALGVDRRPPDRARRAEERERILDRRVAPQRHEERMVRLAAGV